jgi:hypothetical protein
VETRVTSQTAATVAEAKRATLEREGWAAAQHGDGEAAPEETSAHVVSGSSTPPARLSRWLGETRGAVSASQVAYILRLQRVQGNQQVMRLLADSRPHEPTLSQQQPPPARHQPTISPPRAAASANALQANAYTVEADIVNDPPSAAGRRLLAHELTRVVPQRDASSVAQRAGLMSEPSDASEREAEAVAERAVAGERVQVSAPLTVLIARARRPPDVTSNGYQSFYLNAMVPAANAQVRVQFHQDASTPSAATMAVWYQESNTLQTVTFNPGGTIQAAVLSEERGTATFDLNGDEAPEIVLTVRATPSVGLDFAADFRGGRILDMSVAPRQLAPSRGRLIGQLPDGRNYYWTGTFDQRGPRYVDDNGTMVDPGREIASAELNRSMERIALVSWLGAIALLAGAAVLAGAGEVVVAGEVASGAPAAAGAGEAAGAGQLATMTNAQIAQQVIGAQQTALLRTFFGTSLRGAAARAAAFELPAGLTRTSLLAYAEIARRVIAAGNDTLGVQAARLQLIERALKLLP